MQDWKWKHTFLALALMVVFYFVVGAALGPLFVRRERESHIHREQARFQRWLTLESVDKLAASEVVRYRVLDLVTAPDCKDECEVSGFHLQVGEDYCVAFWMQDRVVKRVLVGYQSSKGLAQARERLQTLKRLFGEAEGVSPLYDADVWLRTGSLRPGAKIRADLKPAWFVVSRQTRVLFWCYWEADGSGRVLQRGLYGS